jgi:hypothetical protein
VRAFIALAITRALGDGYADPEAFERRAGRGHEAFFAKANVPAHSISDALAQLRPYGDAVLAPERRMSVLGQLIEAGAVQVPPSTRAVFIDTPIVAPWGANGAPKALGKLGLSAAALEVRRVAAMTAIADFLARSLDPVAFDAIQSVLNLATSVALGLGLLDPTSGEVPGARPSSLTYGIGVTPSSGDVATDIGAVLHAISDGNALAPVLVVSFGTLLRVPSLVADLRDAGVRVIVSPAAGDFAIAIDASGVAVVDEGVLLDATTHATIEMLDNPTNNSVTPTPTNMVSLWQTNSIGLRAERFVNWVARPGAVALVDVSAGSPA